MKMAKAFSRTAIENVDDVRGFERQIHFSEAGGHSTCGSVPITNCVVELGSIGFEPPLQVLPYSENCFNTLLMDVMGGHCYRPPGNRSAICWRKASRMLLT